MFLFVFFVSVLSHLYSPSQVPRKVLDVSNLSDEELIHRLQNMGGTPKELLENKEIMKIAARIFRADLTLLQNYK